VASIYFGSNPAVVGLDIGTDHVRLAQVKQTAATFALQRYGVVGVPMGAVVEGEITDVDMIAASIRELARSTGMNGANAAVGVSNQKVVVRLVDLPYMERAELEGAIQYQAQDYIPIPVEDAILDFQIIDDYVTAADEHMMEVLLVAAQRDMIGGAVAAVERAGLKLQQIDVTSFAIVRGLLGVTQNVLPDESEQAGEATGIIHMSAGITNIAVVEKGVPRFTRVSSLAGNEFTRAIANALNLTFDEAEELKLRVGLPGVDASGVPTEAPADLDPSTVRAAQEALEREVGKFVAEVRRSLDYYLTQAAQVRTIRRILLTGSAAQLTNLDGYLARGLQAQVELADPLRWLQVPPQYQAVMQADRMGAVAAIGLAMGSVVS
jgi:type IV pilus assembly protein PilM